MLWELIEAVGADPFFLFLGFSETLQHTSSPEWECHNPSRSGLVLISSRNTYRAYSTRLPAVPT